MWCSWLKHTHIFWLYNVWPRIIISKILKHAQGQCRLNILGNSTLGKQSFNEPLDINKRYVTWVWTHTTGHWQEGLCYSHYNIQCQGFVDFKCADDAYKLSLTPDVSFEVPKTCYRVALDSSVQTFIPLQATIFATFVFNFSTDTQELSEKKHLCELCWICVEQNLKEMPDS